MLHVGLDLSRRRLDFDLLCEDGSRIERDAVAPDADGLRRLVRRVAVYREPVRAAIESMNGAGYVHDELERSGWEVEVADAQKVKGLAPLASKTDRIDAWVLAELSRRELVPAIWLPSFEQRGERERARWRLFLVRKRSSLKHRVHAQRPFQYYTELGAKLDARPGQLARVREELQPLESLLQLIRREVVVDMLRYDEPLLARFLRDRFTGHARRFLQRQHLPEALFSRMR